MISAAFRPTMCGLALALLLSMPERDLKKRTKAFGVAIVRLVRTLPYDVGTHHIADQLLRAATRVGANYRASCRAKSNADFISKMAWVEEEADESQFWLEVLVDTETVTLKQVATFIGEADQLVRIAVASINTARGRSR